MNKAFEKILEILDEEREYSYADFDKYVNNCSPCLDSEYDDFFHRGLERSIKVIKEVAEEYNGGWIPCSERLPDEHETMFAKLKGTDKWDSSMPEKISDDVNVTVEFEDGTRKTKTMHTIDGRWKTDINIVKFKVIAWQPLPNPYKE